MDVHVPTYFVHNACSVDITLVQSGKGEFYSRKNHMCVARTNRMKKIYEFWPKCTHLFCLSRKMPEAMWEVHILSHNNGELQFRLSIE